MGKIVSIKPRNKKDRDAARVMDEMVNFQMEKLLKNEKFKLLLLLNYDFSVDELSEYLQKKYEDVNLENVTIEDCKTMTELIYVINK